MFLQRTIEEVATRAALQVRDGSGCAKFARPVNCALVRIVPPEGVVVDPKRRPYVVIDPPRRSSGIGGFKDDSQVGVALREGHPVYFVIFFRDPEPGQTLLDVCEAEKQFVRQVRKLHPDSPKPAIVGNCQGGWAAMMLAAADPDDTGPIVINGAPMSYWGGAWQSEATTRCGTRAACSAVPGSRRWCPMSGAAFSMAHTWCRTSRTSTPRTRSGTSTTTSTPTSTPSRPAFSTSSVGGAGST